MTDITRILIVEWEPRLRQDLTSTLTEVGFAVVDVPDYLGARSKLYMYNVDLAIVDEVLLSGDGKGLCSLLHHRNTPVILLGKDSTGGAMIRALEAGADFYFTKPPHRQELVARVKAILRRYKETSA